MHQHPQHARVDLARGFINRHDAPDMQRRFAIVLFAAQEFRLRVHHLQFAAVGIELDLAEQRDARARRQPVGEIGAVEPFAEQ